MASFPHPSLRFRQANEIYRVGCRSLYDEFGICAKKRCLHSQTVYSTLTFITIHITVLHAVQTKFMFAVFCCKFEPPAEVYTCSVINSALKITCHRPFRLLITGRKLEETSSLRGVRKILSATKKP